MTSQVFDQVSMNAPMAMYHLAGSPNRWFVVERNGRVRVFDDMPNPTNNDVSTFVDLNFPVMRVDAEGEGGLLDIAFHPQFGSGGNYEVFVSYTRDNGGPNLIESVISRFYSLNMGATLDSTVEEVILTIPQDFNNHNGGQIRFGQDGFLYAGWGDGGSGGDPLDRAEDTTNLLGAFTRIDVDGGNPYAIPPGNPFAANAATPCSAGFGGASCPEIFAWGVRNPWRWSFDSQTGALWAGDVGQNAWEEVDVIENGMNYGWDIREGAHCHEPTSGCATAGLVDPITEYDHSQGSSITGGFVYRGSAVPELDGQYVFGDFISGRVWVVPATSSQGTAPTEILDTNFSIVSFAEDLNGELYIIDIGGAVHQIVDMP